MKKLLLPVLGGVLVLAGSTFARSQAESGTQPQAQPQAQSSGAQSKPDTRINGKWHFVFDTEGGDREFEADFTVDAQGKVTGTFGKSAAAGTFKDGHLELLFDSTSEEAGETAPLRIDGMLDDQQTILGTWQFSSYDGSFRAVHPRPDQPSHTEPSH